MCPHQNLASLALRYRPPVAFAYPVAPLERFHLASVQLRKQSIFKVEQLLFVKAGKRLRKLSPAHGHARDVRRLSSSDRSRGVPRARCDWNKILCCPRMPLSVEHVHRLYQRHGKLSLYHQRLATTMTRRIWPMISSCLTSCIVAAASHIKFPDSRFAKSLCCAIALL